MQEIVLKIAEFRIKLYTESKRSLILEEGYIPFITDSKGNEDVSVQVFDSIPDGLLINTPVLYSATMNGKAFWMISTYGNKYKFTVFKQNDTKEIQQVALVDRSFFSWQIFTNPTKIYSQQGVYPLLYPMGPLIIYYLTVKKDAIMIHASGVHDGEKGRIFTGISGVGKSTIAKLWNHSGSKIIHDDRLIIRKRGNCFVMYNTPMGTQHEPNCEKLDYIYLPYHRSENILKKIEESKSVSRLMANCFQHGYNRNYIQSHLSVLIELCNKVPVYEFGFKPDKTIVDFLKNNE